MFFLVLRSDSSGNLWALMHEILYLVLFKIKHQHWTVRPGGTGPVGAALAKPLSKILYSYFSQNRFVSAFHLDVAMQFFLLIWLRLYEGPVGQKVAHIAGVVFLSPTWVIFVNKNIYNLLELWNQINSFIIS